MSIEIKVNNGELLIESYGVRDIINTLQELQKLFISVDPSAELTALLNHKQAQQSAHRCQCHNPAPNQNFNYCTNCNKSF